MNKMYAIGPLKLEFISRNPDIVQIHDAFTEAELKETAVSVHSTKIEAMTGLKSGSNETEEMSHLPGGQTDIHVESVSSYLIVAIFKSLSCDFVRTFTEC